MVRSALMVAVLLVASGCSVAASHEPADFARSSGAAPSAAETTPTALPTPEPCPPVPSIPPPVEPLPPDLEEATLAAIQKRAEYGLRRDLAWVRQVAADPRATTDFGVPMLPEEIESLFARNQLSDPVQAAMGRYGQGDQFGGLYLDNALGGVIVVLWTSDPATLEATIRPQLPRCHPVLFRQVRWSEAELRRWQNRIAADWDWFAEIPAAPQGVGADITQNVVTVEISSAGPAAADIIIAHYGAPTGMIRVESDGTGAALLPTGTVVGRVLTADGRRPGPNDLMVDNGSPDDPPGWCGGGDVGYGVGVDGRFEYPCKTGRRTILIQDWTSDGEHPVIASVVVEVPAGGVVEVTIRLPEGFDPGATP